MTQVTENILLRQQNNELLKRLKVVGQSLKSLFESTSKLNGVLDDVTLRKSVLASLPEVLQDTQVRAAWLTADKAGWKLVERMPALAEGEAPVFGTVEDFEKTCEGWRDRKCITFEHQEKATDVLQFECVNEAMANIYFQEVKTAFQKVKLHQDLANRDGLTRVYNHRYFQARLRQELSVVKRQNAQLSVILMDVDHFKNYNDNNGHPAGDKLLRQLAHLLDYESGNRESDVIARYGGEEFVLLLPFTPYEGALTKAERLRSKVEAHPFDHREKQPLGKVSLSIGVASFPEHGDSPESLVEAADQALYSAKEAGRNKVVGAQNSRPRFELPS